MYFFKIEIVMFYIVIGSHRSNMASKSHPRIIKNESSKPDRCIDLNCSHFIAVKTRHEIDARGISLDQVDWIHMRENHMRMTLTYAEEQVKTLQKDIDLKDKEIDLKDKEIKLQSDKIVLLEGGSSNGYTKIDTRLEVNPKNHVDGICDALVANGTYIYKCTDSVRHGKKVCGPHEKAVNLVK